jgi:hypothetical protein
MLAALLPWPGSHFYMGQLNLPTGNPIFLMIDQQNPNQKSSS